MFFFFFFFQAEDGIRDLTVTGVQTCALPIYPFCRKHVAGSQHPEQPRRYDAVADALRASDLLARCREIGPRAVTREDLRSEERRVGKECRSRWWPYH